MWPLTSLTCFKHIHAIEPITAGLSSMCYQVSADNRLFFAKQLTNSSEATISKYAALHNIAPRVIYHDPHWLITEFIDGTNLALNSQSLDEKIVTAIKLMARCHQLSVKPVELSPVDISRELIKNTDFSNLKQTELIRVADRLTPQLKHSRELVCCHGDINFSNVLVDDAKSAYLVDFECAISAPAEFDLAMFFAVNNITKNKTATILELYKKHSSHGIDPSLLNEYLLFCYFINGLWYINTYNSTKLLKLLPLAEQQWKNIPSFNKKIFFDEKKRK